MKAAIKFLRSLGQNRRELLNLAFSSTPNKDSSSKITEKENHQNSGKESIRLPSLNMKKGK